MVHVDQDPYPEEQYGYSLEYMRTKDQSLLSPRSLRFYTDSESDGLDRATTSFCVDISNLGATSHLYLQFFADRLPAINDGAKGIPEEVVDSIHLYFVVEDNTYYEIGTGEDDDMEKLQTFKTTIQNLMDIASTEFEPASE